MTETLPLDLEVLDENFELDPEGLREMIDLYIVQAEETLAGLRTAIEDGEADHVNYLAHRLAGASAVCGAAAMVGPLRMLEQRGCEGQLSDGESLVATIDERLELCRRLLEEYFEQRGV